MVQLTSTVPVGDEGGETFSIFTSGDKKGETLSTVTLGDKGRETSSVFKRLVTETKQYEFFQK